jgi:hypothetical protein
MGRHKLKNPLKNKNKIYFFSGPAGLARPGRAEADLAGFLTSLIFEH